MKRNKWKAVIFNTVLIPLAAVFALYYSSYHHFGMTELGINFVGNRLTLESMVYGLVIGFVIAGVMIWFSCVYSVFTTDKVVYLFGKVSPAMSVLIARGGTAANYTPIMDITPVSGRNVWGFAAYCVFLSLPTVLYIKEAIQWRISRSGI